MHLYKIVCACIACLLCAKATAGVFDTVKLVENSKRLDVAENLYQNKLRHMDSSSAIAALNQLVAIAQQLGDDMLVCYAWSTLADHYARLRGLTAL